MLYKSRCAQMEHLIYRYLAKGIEYAYKNGADVVYVI